MQAALGFVFTCISRSVQWLSSWNFRNVPFLVWLIAFIVTATILDYIFG